MGLKNRFSRSVWADSAVGGSPLHGKVDGHRIAIAGHSLGAYLATFAAVKADTEGPRLSALILLDPSDERLGTNTKRVLASLHLESAA